MKKNPMTKEQLIAENEDLRRRLEEAEETLRAIHEGEVDALVLSKPEGEVVFTLKGAEHPYRVFVEAMQEGAVTLASDGTILYCNDRFAEMVKMPSDELFGSSIYPFIPSGDRPGFESAFQKGSQEGATIDLSLEGKRRKLIPVHLSFNTLHGQDTPAVCMVAMNLTEHKRLEDALRQLNADLERRVEDRTAELVKVSEALRAEILERQRAEQELRKSRDKLEFLVQERTEELAKANESLRDLSSRLLFAQEEERKRIAGELHDTIGSSLNGIKFKVEQALQQLGKAPDVAAESLNAVVPVIREGIEECRRMQQDLRPSILDDLGLLATLSWFCRRYEAIYTGIKIETEQTVEETDIPDSLKVVIFRVTQEGMNNIAKHSKADRVRLSLGKMDARIELVLSDNGQGFDLNKVLTLEKTKRGLGLTSMKERTHLSGGSFAIESAEGKGTTVRASWPLSGHT